MSEESEYEGPTHAEEATDRRIRQTLLDVHEAHACIDGGWNVDRAPLCTLEMPPFGPPSAGTFLSLANYAVSGTDNPNVVDARFRVLATHISWTPTQNKDTSLQEIVLRERSPRNWFHQEGDWSSFHRYCSCYLVVERLKTTDIGDGKFPL